MSNPIFDETDRVRWSDIYLLSLGIVPNPNRPSAIITKTGIRAGQLSYEICFESDKGVAYVLASADMLERADA